MTIFPEKNKAGSVTGVWIVEVRKMKGGVSKTVRRRTRDYNEAKRIEASLRSVDPPQIFPVASQTLSFNLPSTFVRTPVDSEDTPPIGSGSGFDLTTVTPKVFNLQDLYDGARSIYLGNKDEQQSCERLHAALEIIGLDVDIRELRTPAMDYLVQVLQARKLSPKTVNRYLYAISGALRWALSRELIPGMPVVPRQSEGVGRINFLTEEDQHGVIQWLTDHGFPDVAFATKILLLTGFRISEFLGLNQSKIRGDWVHLNPGETKNDQGRSVFIGDLADELSAQIKAGLPTYLRITKGLSDASAALSIKPKITCHVLRHTTATRLTTKGVSLATVGKLMGHRSLNTTIKYAHVEDQALIAAAKLLMDQN